MNLYRIKHLGTVFVLFLTHSCTNPRFVTPAPSVYNEQLKSIVETFPLSVTASNNESVCTGHDSLQQFSCQPLRTLRALGLAQSVLSLARNVSENIESKIGQVFTDNNSEFLQKNYKIQFRKKSRSEIQLTGIANAKTFLSLKHGIADTQNELTLDLSSTPSELIPPVLALNLDTLLTAKWKFTDSTHWEISLSLANTTPCVEQSPYRAKSTFINIVQNDSVFDIHTSEYLPTWAEGLPALNSATCQETPDPTLSGFIYTELKVKENIFKGAVYSLSHNQGNETDVANFKNFALKDTCTTLGLSCGSLDLSTLTNTFCYNNSTSALTWNDSCASQNATLGSSSFSTSLNWLNPGGLKQLCP